MADNETVVLEGEQYDLLRDMLASAGLSDVPAAGTIIEVQVEGGPVEKVRA